jgi:quercetin dioxygenase-like cupin family protein
LVNNALSGLAGAADDENGVGGRISNPSIEEASMTTKVSLAALAREHLEAARAVSSGRSAHTVYGGHEHSLRQTLIALTAGSEMDDHESPGEATLQVLVGRVRLTNGQTHWDGTVGDHIVVPLSRHGLQALEDSAVLLTVAKAVGPHV